MLMRQHRAQRGDTIIEVLLAVTIFSMVAIGALTIMNQGVSTSQRSLEVTLVRQQMDAQIEALRLLHGASLAAPTGASTDSMVTTWRNVIRAGAPATPVTEFGLLTPGGQCQSGPAISSSAFIINTNDLTVVQPVSVALAETFAQIRYSAGGGIPTAEGLWIEAIKHERGVGETAPGYIDFHVRACWNASGAQLPMTLGTIVRLYDPAL